MAKRRLILQRKPAGGGGVLAAFVVLMAAAACLLVSPPKVTDVVAVFAKGTPPPNAAVEAVGLPAMEWFLVEANGQAVAACGELLEAELIRQSFGGTASVRRVTTDEVSMKFTAPAQQLAALRESADALVGAFRTLERMARMPPAEAQSAAKIALMNLDDLCGRVDRTLANVENPIARGLAGLAGSCREAMETLSRGTTEAETRKKHASLALQYASYIAFLHSTKGEGSGPSPSPGPSAAARP